MEKTKDPVRRYEEVRPKYEKFATKLENLLETLLEAQGIKFSIVESRVKPVESFKKKITRPTKNYSDPISQITDLSGVRIILYYSDDVARVVELLKKELEIDTSQSIAQTQRLEPQEFGYASEHYIVSLDTFRAGLSEWKEFSDLKAEVQVRTVLQHGWASISHALDYKRENEAPSSLRRKLFRLSALLELADEQFSEIREARDSLSNKIFQEMRKGEPNVELNLDTLKEFIGNSELINDLVKSGKSAGFSITDEVFIKELLTHCEFLKIKTIGEIESQIRDASSWYTGYFQQLIDHAPNRKWQGSPAFLVVLVLLRTHRQKIKLADMERLGWQEDTAENVLRAISENVGKNPTI